MRGCCTLSWQGSGKWSIDHIIAKVHFSNSLRDQMRLHHAGNLATSFVNSSKSTTLQGYEQLQKLRAHWPLSWGDRLPSQVHCPAHLEQDLRSPRESPAVDFIDLIDYSVWEEAWVDSLREAFELSE